MKPVFYVLAGPNGAGKTTLYEPAGAAGLIPSQAEFVNADVHELDIALRPSQRPPDLMFIGPHPHGRR